MHFCICVCRCCVQTKHDTWQRLSGIGAIGCVARRRQTRIVHSRQWNWKNWANVCTSYIYICVMGVLCAVCNCGQPFTLQTLCINVCVCNNSCSTLGVVVDFVCFFFSYIFLISTILYDVSLPPLAMDHLDALHSSSIRGDHAIGYNIRTHTRLMSVKCEGRGARINSRGTDFSSVTSSSFFLPSSQSWMHTRYTTNVHIGDVVDNLVTGKRCAQNH